MALCPARIARRQEGSARKQLRKDMRQRQQRKHGHEHQQTHGHHPRKYGKWFKKF
jgi:hypothetical protein